MEEDKAKRTPVEIRRIGGRFSQLSFIREGKCGFGKKSCQILEVFIVIVLIFLAWSLLSLPLIFYHLETQEVS